MSISTTVDGQRIGNGLGHRKADPLAWWCFGVPRLREAFALFVGDEPISELHLRACNKGGKTLSKAMYVTACLEKREVLDGVPLPQWNGPVEALQLVLDYPQQLLSVKPAYLKALGNWPAEIKMNGEYLSSIRVMPVGGDDDKSRWSVIHFLSQKNVDTGKGARADIIDFDEPPKMEFLDELRKAGHAGRRSIRIIGETPLKRREWAPLRADYGDCPRSSIRRVDKYRAECRWSLGEVESWILSDVEKAELLAAWTKRDGVDARREHGDYESTEGRCPFDDVTIMAMMSAWCRDPEIRKLRIAIEDPDGRPKQLEPVRVEVWQHPYAAVGAYQAVDPASGVDDSAHNPAGLQLHDERTGDLLVRWNGYLAPYSVGALAAVLHRHYGGCATDIEMMDHWGVNVMRGYKDNGGSNVCFERRELRPDLWAKEEGFRVTAETRAIWIGCIQEWIAAFKAGAPYAVCRSRAVFECLLDMELDDRDRPVAGPGIAHAEDFVLLGQRLRRLQRPKVEQRELYRPTRSPDEHLIDMIRGHDDDDEADDVAYTVTRRPMVPRG